MGSQSHRDHPAVATRCLTRGSGSTQELASDVASQSGVASIAMGGRSRPLRDVSRILEQGRLSKEKERSVESEKSLEGGRCAEGAHRLDTTSPHRAASLLSRWGVVTRALANSGSRAPSPSARESKAERSRAQARVARALAGTTPHRLDATSPHRAASPVRPK